MRYLSLAYFEPARDLVVWAPRGGGKTRLGAVATLLDLAHKPGCSVRILGGSLEQSLRMWEHLSPDLVGNFGEKRVTLRAKRVEVDNGSSAAVVAQSQRAVRGLRVQKLRCDEVELFDPEIWEAAQLVTRTRRDISGGISAGTIEALSTFHKPGGLMQRITEQAESRGAEVIKWCLMEVLEKCPPERECATCPLHEECVGRAKEMCDGHFSIDDAIRMKRRVSRECWETEMLCRRPSVRGRVFPSFNMQTHVRRDVAGEVEEHWLAIDFGFANPFVCLWIAEMSGGDVHVIDEYVQTARTVAEHLVEIAARPWSRARVIGCDPAGNGRNEQTSQSNVDLLRRDGYVVRYRSSRIAEGLELIRAGLRSATGDVSLWIHPRCERLIRAMQSYRYPEEGGETPVKDGEHDHLIDALRYFYVNRQRGGVVVRTY